MTTLRSLTARGATVLVAITALASASTAVPAQQTAGAPRPLSLADALRLAELTSDALRIARAERSRAAGQTIEGRSARLPRLSAYSTYDRSLRSEFEDLAVFGGDSASDSGDTPDIPFGSANTYRMGLAASYTIYSGGRALAASRALESGQRAAEIALASERASLLLQVTEAYYDAVLSEQLERIAEWTLAQAESSYRRASLVTQVGRGSEFELVRARVTRDRHRPALIQRRADREIAMLRLRQLLHYAPDEELTLTSGLDLDAPPSIVTVASFGSTSRSDTTPDATLDTAPIADRAAVRIATESVRRSEQVLRATRAGRIPSIAITSTYERVAYPRRGTPGWNDFRTNWTVGARLDVPLFTGGAQRGGEMSARADFEAARASLRQIEQLAALDARTAAARLAAAHASWEATEGTAHEAHRAYEIASLRQREGLSTQLELADARILVEEARAERARAARDVLVERARAALLSDLPLEGGSSPSPARQRSGAAELLAGAPQSTSRTTITSGARTP